MGTHRNRTEVPDGTALGFETLLRGLEPQPATLFEVVPELAQMALGVPSQAPRACASVLAAVAWATQQILREDASPIPDIHLRAAAPWLARLRARVEEDRAAPPEEIERARFAAAQARLGLALALRDPTEADAGLHDVMRAIEQTHDPDSARHAIEFVREITGSFTQHRAR